MKKLTYILLMVILCLLSIFWLCEAWGALGDHWHNFYRWCQNTHRSYYPWLLWMGIGASIFPLINKRWVNSEMIKTLRHEEAHLFISLITQQPVDSLYASSKEGGMVRSRRSVDSKVPRFLSSLAPYCFPYFTIILLLLRCLCMAKMLPIMDVLIGLSVGMHVVCFKEQIGNHQPDITSYPLWFSYTYIVHFWLFDIALLLMSIAPKSNIFLAFRDFGVDFWNVLVHLF